MPFRRVFYPDFVLPPEGGGGFASLVSSLSPTSWWRLGESSGTTAVDEQGLNNGIYTGSITLGSTGLVSGDSDTAITLTASGAYVDVTAASTVYADLTGGFSVLAITDLASIPASQFASICRLKSSSSAPFGLAYSNAAGYTDISFGLLPSTSRIAIATITGPTMLLVTYNGTAYSVYVNGSLVANIAGGNYSGVTNSTILGNINATTQFFNGVLDEIAVWSGTVLSSTDAMDLAIAAGYA